MKPEAKKVLEQNKKRMAKVSSDYKMLFESPQGKTVLEHLKIVFDPPILCKANADTTLIRAAQRDVIRFIDDTIKGGVKNELESD